MMIVAFTVLSYVLFRLLNRGWVLPFETGRRIALPMGLAAGALQGASGISAPISLSFLNALRLDRPVFIATVSTFFTAMSALQGPTAAYFGIITWHRLALSVMALVPILCFMPVGGLLAKRFSKETFDRVILCLLAALALKLFADALL